MSNTYQHPLEPNPKYHPKLVQLAIRTVAATVRDFCRISRPRAVMLGKLLLIANRSAIAADHSNPA
jgi:hypothetical protein